MENKIKITVGSTNEHKIYEMNLIAKGFNIEFVPVDKKLFNPNENGVTFSENAYIKAMEAKKVSDGKLFLADDSGLCVDYLKGAPGIYSARYESTQEKRIQKLLYEMQDAKKRDAKFVCSLCLINSNGEILHTEEGVVKGKIGYSTKGINGFGYDPVFIVDKLNKTMAELSDAEKNTLSHRGIALLNMLKWLEKAFRQEVEL